MKKIMVVLMLLSTSAFAQEHKPGDVWPCNDGTGDMYGIPPGGHEVLRFHNDSDPVKTPTKSTQNETIKVQIDQSLYQELYEYEWKLVSKECDQYGWHAAEHGNPRRLPYYKNGHKYGPNWKKLDTDNRQVQFNYMASKINMEEIAARWTAYYQEREKRNDEELRKTP